MSDANLLDLLPMYPGVVNSPETFTTAPLTVGATSITVQNVASVVPDAPCLMVLGGGLGHAETVLVTAVSGNVLTVQRGVQGAAQTWAVGTTVACNFTEAHYRTLVENLERLNTGKTSQADFVTKTVSNPNILHNWDLRNPVNTRGQTVYSIPSGTAPAIDRYMILGPGELRIEPNGIRLTRATAQNFHLDQVTAAASTYAGKTLTFSAIIDGELYTTTSNVPLSQGTIIDQTAPWGGVLIRWLAGDIIQTRIYLTAGGAQSIELSLLKLEVGVVSTLPNDLPMTMTQSGGNGLPETLSVLTQSGWVSQVSAEMRGTSNILHNWDFRNPVNQRGLATYEGVTRYSIDRWIRENNLRMSVQASGLVVTTLNNGGTWLFQHIENSHLYLGRTITISAVINGIMIAHTLTLPTAFAQTTNILYPAGGNVGVGMIIRGQQLSACVALTHVSGGTAATVQAVKLEMGTASTLANDAPMDFGKELAICQRFYEKSVNMAVDPSAPTGANRAPGVEWVRTLPVVPNGSVIANVRFKSTKRITPTVTVRSFIGTAHQVSNFNGIDRGANSGGAHNVGENGFNILNLAPSFAAENEHVIFHWEASADL